MNSDRPCTKGILSDLGHTQSLLQPQPLENKVLTITIISLTILDGVLYMFDVSPVVALMLFITHFTVFTVSQLHKPMTEADRHGSKVLIKVLRWRTESFTLFLVPRISTGVILQF